MKNWDKIGQLVLMGGLLLCVGTSLAICRAKAAIPAAAETTPWLSNSLVIKPGTKLEITTGVVIINNQASLIVARNEPYDGNDAIFFHIATHTQPRIKADEHTLTFKEEGVLTPGVTVRNTRPGFILSVDVRLDETGKPVIRFSYEASPEEEDSEVDGEMLVAPRLPLTTKGVA